MHYNVTHFPFQFWISIWAYFPFNVSHVSHLISYFEGEGKHLNWNEAESLKEMSKIRMNLEEMRKAEIFHEIDSRIMGESASLKTQYISD